MRIPPLSLLSDLLSAAMRAGDAVGGNIQVLDGNRLFIIAHQGLTPEFIEHFGAVSADDGSACAQALRDRRRIVIRDMDTDAEFAPHLAVARQSGVRAVQSTPLLDSHHRLSGVLSTHFAAPHHPSPGDFALIDACASVTGRMIEIHRMHDAIATADAELGMADRALSPLAAQAADAAPLLIRAARRGDARPLLESADRHLSVVAGELDALLARYRNARLADTVDIVSKLRDHVH